MYKYIAMLLYKYIHLISIYSNLILVLLYSTIFILVLYFKYIKYIYTKDKKII